MSRSAKKNQFSQIGQNIKHVREFELRWTTKEFADKMEVTVHTVHDWENGITDLIHASCKLQKYLI